MVAEYSTVVENRPKAISYLTTDTLGSPRIVTDQVGKVVSRHDYLAYGDDIAETLGNVGGRNATQGYGTEENVRKQYTGYEHDNESGLDYAQARYYNSKQGRFTSVDPLTASANVKDPQTFNRYTYALNSPYKFTDPLGLVANDAGGGSKQGNDVDHTWRMNPQGVDLDFPNGAGWHGDPANNQAEQQNETTTGTLANEEFYEKNSSAPTPSAEQNSDNQSWHNLVNKYIGDNPKNAEPELRLSCCPRPARRSGRNGRGRGRNPFNRGRGRDWEDGAVPARSLRRPDPRNDPGRENGPIFSGLKDHAQ